MRETPPYTHMGHASAGPSGRRHVRSPTRATLLRTQVNAHHPAEGPLSPLGPAHCGGSLRVDKPCCWLHRSTAVAR